MSKVDDGRDFDPDGHVSAEAQERFLDHLKASASWTAPGAYAGPLRLEASAVEVVAAVEAPTAVEVEAAGKRLEDEADHTVYLYYTNWKGARSLRRVLPERIWFGRSAWHNYEPQWFLKAHDLEKNEGRDFALKAVVGWFATAADATVGMTREAREKEQLAGYKRLVAVVMRGKGKDESETVTVEEYSAILQLLTLVGTSSPLGGALVRLVNAYTNLLTDLTRVYHTPDEGASADGGA